MSAIDLDESLARVRQRLATKAPPAAGRRRDRGSSRLSPEVERHLGVLLGRQERPSFVELHRELAAFCRERGLRAPARSSLYNAVERVAVPVVPWSTLPREV